MTAFHASLDFRQLLDIDIEMDEICSIDYDIIDALDMQHCAMETWTLFEENELNLKETEKERIQT